jgi:predicted ester cyclase
MNKARRHEFKMLKYKKRIKLYGFTSCDIEKDNLKLHAFRSHSVPCSCGVCRSEKYRNTLRQQSKKIDLKFEYE